MKKSNQKYSKIVDLQNFLKKRTNLDTNNIQRQYLEIANKMKVQI